MSIKIRQVVSVGNHLGNALHALKKRDECLVALK
jgi:hypothetical protein